MRFLSPIAAAILSCAALCAPVHAQKAPAAPPTVIANALPAIDPAHLQAVSEMLDAMQVGELVMAGMRGAKATSPEHRDFNTYMLSHIGKADVLRVFAPVYAREVGADEARRLTALFRQPRAQKAISAQLELLGLPGQVRRLSDQEARALVAAYDASGDGARYSAMVKRGLAAANVAMSHYVAQYLERLVAVPMRAIAAHRQAWQASGMLKEPELFVPEKVGLSYIDAFASLVATAGYRNQHASWTLERDLAALKAADVIAPEKLLLPGNLARARTMVDDADTSLEIFLSATDANVSTFRKALAELRIPGTLGDSTPLTRALEHHMGRNVKFAENQRAIVGQMRRVLDFVEAHKGAIGVKDTTYLFATAADADQYNALIAEMQRLVVQGKAIQAEASAEMAKAADGAGL